MLAILKPLVLTSLKSEKFKKFVVELLEKLVESTDNELDDRALQIVKKGLNVLPKRSALPAHGNTTVSFFIFYSFQENILNLQVCQFPTLNAHKTVLTSCHLV